MEDEMRFAMRRRKGPRSSAALPFDHGFSTKQVTGMVVAMALAVLLYPAGARAANSLFGAVITDPGGANKAKVDASGNLQVGGTVNVGNTPNVNVGNFPATTSASQSGNWTVGLNSGTNVGVDPSANTVKVDSTSPLGVTSADDPGRAAYQIEKDFQILEPNFLGETTFIVPVGKRLVIRFVSTSAFLPVGQNLVGGYNVDTYIDGVIVRYFLSAAPTGSQDNFALYTSAQETLIYAEGLVRIQLERSDVTGDASLSVAMSGYLIDCSVAPCN
jgi:hypothetical protein